MRIDIVETPSYYEVKSENPYWDVAYNKYLEANMPIMNTVAKNRAEAYVSVLSALYRMRWGTQRKAEIEIVRSESQFDAAEAEVQYSDNVSEQLITAIEETLIVYHEPYFVRWACKVLQGENNEKLGTEAWYVIDTSEYSQLARNAARYCMISVWSPLGTPNLKSVSIASAIEAALQAQDEMALADE